MANRPRQTGWHREFLDEGCMPVDPVGATQENMNKVTRHARSNLVTTAECWQSAMDRHDSACLIGIVKQIISGGWALDREFSYGTVLLFAEERSQMVRLAMPSRLPWSICY